ncbi:MAG: homoserine dehydrogenase [Eubacterium sp.]
MKKYGLAILGFGTVGSGTYEILNRNHSLIRKRIGADYEVRHILVRHPEAAEKNGADPELLTTQPEDVFQDPQTDIVVECIGGQEPAKTYILEAMKNGKHVVSPNKAVIAANFQEMEGCAEENGVDFRYEASVGGGIPILTSITEALSANNFTRVSGIVNGTTNYILTQMAVNDLDYATALKMAQDNGFAEADPTADVEGIDCANKLSILISLCFGKYVRPEDIPRTGISSITKEDIQNAKDEKTLIKLLSHAEKKEDGTIDCWIRPTRIPQDHPLAYVNNEFNSVVLTGDMVGETMFVGKGAGALPTGSAVVGDLIAIMRDHL